jgi:hypothetical protein
MIHIQLLETKKIKCCFRSIHVIQFFQVTKLLKQEKLGNLFIAKSFKEHWSSLFTLR